MKSINFVSYLALRTFSASNRTFKKVQANNAKSGSSHEWLSRQLSDPFVELAKKLNYRCRSAFKLIEIDEKYNILKPGYTVIDCGAAPGSWTQVAVKKVNANLSDKKNLQGIVIAIDKQPIYPIEGATIFSSSDFSDLESQEKIITFLKGKRADSILSDMAPNASGIKELDKEKIIQLCYMALKFAITNSNENASVLLKLWQCGQTEKLKNDMEKFYNFVKIIKPNSSRSDSAEIFILGQDFKGLKTSS